MVGMRSNGRTRPRLRRLCAQCARIFLSSGQVGRQFSPLGCIPCSERPMLASSRRWYARRDAGLSGRWARPARAIVRAMSTDPDLQLAVVWLRNDLRVRDNAALRAAADLCTQGAASHALPVYTLNPRTFGTTRWGNPKTGPYRAQFLIESVLDLKQRLRDLGSDLLVAVGHPEDVFARLAGPARSLVVLTQEEVTSEELRDDERVRSALGSRGELRRVRGHTLVHRDDLPLAADLVDMPDVFTQFRKRVEAAMRVRDESPQLRPGELQLPPEEYFTSTGLSLAFEPALSDLPTPVPFARPVVDSRACMAFLGGESAALARLHHFVWGPDRLPLSYLSTRDGMVGPDYSTKLAPWLALGCVSPRVVWREIKAFEDRFGATESTYWVQFELLCRDFFRYVALKHGNRIFQWHGLVGRGRAKGTDGVGTGAADGVGGVTSAAGADGSGGASASGAVAGADGATGASLTAEERLCRWKEGRTGMPLVDANMRELAATGFMSNRGRQNVASYLVHDLGLDWRQGADWFESLLVDYDVCSNWGNWVFLAGLSGGRVNRFHVTKQGLQYDPEGCHARLWLPELRDVPGGQVHEPWLLTEEQQAAWGVRVGVDYPMPIVAPRPFVRLGGGEGSLGRGKGRRGAGGRGAGP